ncbi:hypothetical protein KAJ27_01555 [bacterium]|nr:hypothetical protein [bacterium]
MKPKTLLGLEFGIDSIKGALLRLVTEDDLQIINLIEVDIIDDEINEAFIKMIENAGQFDKIVTVVNDRNTIQKKTSGAIFIRKKLQNEILIEMKKDYGSYGLIPKYYDFININEFDKKLKSGEEVINITLGLKVVKENREVDKLIELFKTAGVFDKLESVEIDSISLYNLYNYVTEGIEITENIALINVGRNQILIVITGKDKSYYYSRVIPIIEDNIGEAINSLNNTFVIPDIIREIGSIKRVLLTGEKESVEFVKSQFVWISKLYENLTFAVDSEILDKFKGEDDFEVRGIEFNLAEKFDSQIGLSEIDNYAIPIALALKGLVPVRIDFDLLRPQRNERKMKLLKKTLSLGAILILAMMSFYIIYFLIPMAIELKKEKILLVKSSELEISGLKRKLKIYKEIMTKDSPVSLVKRTELEKVKRITKNNSGVLPVFEGIQGLSIEKLQGVKLTGDSVELNTKSGEKLHYRIVEKK